MNRRTSIFALAVSLSFLLPNLARAQAIAIANDNGVMVFAEAKSSADVLVTLSKGKKISVTGQRGEFYQVKIQLPDGFVLDGFTPVHMLTIVSGYVAPPVQAEPRPSSAPAWAAPESNYPSPSRSAPRPPPPSRSSGSSSSDSYDDSSSSSSDFGELKDRFRLRAGPGILIYSYKFLTAGAKPGQLFTYNLSGLAANIEFTGWVFEGSDRTFRIGLTGGYEHAFFRTKTNVSSASASGNSKTAANSIDDMSGGLVLEYRFEPQPNSLTVGVKGGYRWFKFTGDDLTDAAGKRLNIYVSQTVSSILGGPYVVIPLDKGKSFLASLGIDLLLKNTVKESPAGTSGATPKGKFGYVPSLFLTYGFSARHWADLGYRMYVQNFSYSGLASRASNNVTDGTAKTLLHEFRLSYEYRF
ncbi:MAG: hypothetical protein V1495_02085 [Pseudomonadota bacterium]